MQQWKSPHWKRLKGHFHSSQQSRVPIAEEWEHVPPSLMLIQRKWLMINSPWRHWDRWVVTSSNSTDFHGISHIWIRIANQEWHHLDMTSGLCGTGPNPSRESTRESASIDASPFSNQSKEDVIFQINVQHYELCKLVKQTQSFLVTNRTDSMDSGKYCVPKHGCYVLF